jgi:hypothetical protein
LRAIAGAVSAADLAEHMRAHFAENEKDKHDRLEAALELREPAEADALRASLLPAAGAVAAPASSPRWLVWAALAAVVVIPGAVLLLREPAQSAAPPPPTPTPTLTLSQTSSLSVVPVASPAPTPTPTPSASPTRTAATPAIRSIPMLPSVAVPSASASSRTPDVDPHPF